MVRKGKAHIIGFIFARGGSKGVLRKNIRPLAGKPLLAYAVETALASRFIERVIVSTDDEEIAATARRFGAETPFLRPAELARDDSPEWLAWRHAIRKFMEGDKIDIFVSIPPTAPLRSAADVDTCIETLIDGDADLVCTVKNASRHPAFNMVRIDADGYARLLMPSAKTITRRQEAAPAYDMTTVAYVARPDFILRAQGMFDGRVKTVLIPGERAVDIDTELDLQFAEFLVSKRRKHGSEETR